MLLSSLRLNESATIKKVDTDRALTARLNALGITEGVKVTVVAFSFFSNPIMLKVRGYRLAIRKSIANKIIVERCV